MIDRDRLFRQLDGASFAQRAAIAAAAAADATADELDDLATGLAADAPGVRLGIIDAWRLAGHRGALPALVAHARGRDGDDRVFAIRALAELARAGDEELRADAAAWARAADPFVATHGQRLLTALGPAATRGPGPLEAQVVALFAATRTADRIAGVAAIEARGPAALTATAKLALAKGPADLVALVARALIRQAAALPAAGALVPLIEGARRRLRDEPTATAALDDAARWRSPRRRRATTRRGSRSS